MACTLSAVTLGNGCVDNFGATKKKQIMLQFLCALLQQLDGTEECDFDAILAEAEENGLLCYPSGQIELDTARLIESNQSIDTSLLDCFRPDQLAATELVLVCRILNQFT